MSRANQFVTVKISSSEGFSRDAVIPSSPPFSFLILSHTSSTFRDSVRTSMSGVCVEADDEGLAKSAT